MNNQNSSSFSNGFLLGLIIGGAAVFLLGTKRGKKILKSVSEEGLEGLTEIIEEASTRMEEEEEPEPAQEFPKSNGNGSTPVKRRFFRRTPKS